MRRFLTAFLIATLVGLPSLASTDTESRFYSNGSGATVLIEEHTATYCQTCAQIDPMVLDFLRDNGNRAIRVALHPPADDLLGTEISTHRLSLSGENLSVTPTFVMDGDVVSQGYVDRTDMQLNLRSAELDKRGILSLEAEVLVSGNAIQVSSPSLSLEPNQRLTIFLVERVVVHDFGTSPNGLDQNHDVARAMISIDDENDVKAEYIPDIWNASVPQNVNHTIRFLLSDGDDPLSFDVVLVVESREEGANNILSSTIVRLSEETGDESKVNPLVLVIGIGVMSTLVFIIQSRK
ncbi:MAG: hypothetical protein VYD21_01305 [Candidatus Thermoplasmatota archaeon]|nr:hypothetical protein [Candidatus Thermoplasmatota archaeon]MED5303418.1 hypothetical protein [Candidatus Thermoplasmatota archaeon]